MRSKSPAYRDVTLGFDRYRDDLFRAIRGAGALLGSALVIEAGRASLQLRHPGALWIDLRWATAVQANLILATLGILLAVGISERARLPAALGTLALGAHAARDAMHCADRTGIGSFSSILAIVSVWIVLAHTWPLLTEFLASPRRPPSPCKASHRSSGRRRFVGLAAGSAIASVVLPMSQIAGSMAVDYSVIALAPPNDPTERPADAVVVFGARVYANGTPSLALSDRVRTGCNLVRSGYARKLVVSGGPGDGGIHETDVMKRLAIEQGIDPADIIIDRDGWSTSDTAHNVARLVPAHFGRSPRVLAVSHDYHLARTRLAMSNAGVIALTVPAKQSRPLPMIKYFVAREILGFWAYWARSS